MRELGSSWKQWRGFEKPERPENDLRLLFKQACATQERHSGRVWFQSHWAVCPE